MNETRVANVAGKTQADPTRRSVLRLLGGVALVVRAVGVVQEPVTAKRKTCKRPCNSEERCVRGRCKPIPRP